MPTVTLKKPCVIVPAVAILAVAGAGIAPTITHVTLSLPGVDEILATGRLDGGLGFGGLVLLAVVLFLAGLVSGLAGFAFSAVAACVLWLLPPLQAMPLIMLLSVCNQLLSIGKLRREMVLLDGAGREGALPYILGGLAGAPIGVALLYGLPTSLFAGGLGAFLIVYGVVMLVMPGRLRLVLSGWKTAATVGALGGVVGGFSGFGASIPVVYLGLRGIGKSATRGITQPFIVVMQLVSLTVLAAVDPAVFNRSFWLLCAVTLPGVLLGSGTGVALYRRLSDSNFRYAVLILLMLSGASLVTKAAAA